jgi:hypothetical protein
VGAVAAKKKADLVVAVALVRDIKQCRFSYLHSQKVEKRYYDGCKSSHHFWWCWDNTRENVQIVRLEYLIYKKVP